MKEITATITQRGQVTIPAEVQRLLGLKARGKVTFAIDGDQVRLVPVAFTLETAFGSISPLPGGADLETQIREAKEEKIARDLRRMGEP